MWKKRLTKSLPGDKFLDTCQHDIQLLLLACYIGCISIPFLCKELISHFSSIPNRQSTPAIISRNASETKSISNGEVNIWAWPNITGVDSQLDYQSIGITNLEDFNNGIWKSNYAKVKSINRNLNKKKKPKN